MIITRTPFRVTFFGGGTDYPAWFREHGGETLSASIDKYCYIFARFHPPYFEHKSKVTYNELEKVIDNKDIKHPVVRECLKFLRIEDGIEIHHESDLPAMRGLGSSSSFTVGLLNALYGLNKIRTPARSLAKEACYVDQELVRENVGCQDQYTAAIGGTLHICWGQEPKVYHIPIDGLEDWLMLFSTGTYRRASDIAGGLLRAMPDKTSELQMMLSHVQEGLKYLRTQNLESFGRLMHENWLIKRSLTPDITTPLIDEIYTKALKGGAFGGKLLGAGHGGFMLFVVPPEKQGAVKHALQGFMHVPFSFENTGSQIIYDA